MLTLYFFTHLINNMRSFEDLTVGELVRLMDMVDSSDLTDVMDSLDKDSKYFNQDVVDQLDLLNVKLPTEKEIKKI